MKKDNKHRNSSLSKNEVEHLQFSKLVYKHRQRVVSTYGKNAPGTVYTNKEEGC